MSGPLIVNIFLLNILTLAVGSAKFLQTLYAPQSQLLNLFKPCTIRMVFLENSFAASEDILSFFNFYQNGATFIVESIPLDSRSFKINSSEATSQMQDKRFMTCYTIFYFQDQFFDTLSASDQKEHIYNYFANFSVYLRNEDPTSIIFMNLRSSTVGNEYSLVKNIDITSSFYVLASAHKLVGLICVTCGTLVRVKSFSEFLWRRIHTRAEIPITSLYNVIWETESPNSLDACGISPYERFASRSQPYHDICVYRELRKQLNTSDSRKNGIRAYSKVTWSYLKKKTIKSHFQKHSSNRSVYLPYGMEKYYYRFGAVTRPYGYDIYSLVRPFDLLTWSCLIVSILSFCFYLQILFWIKKERTLLKLDVFSVLMEQSQSIVRECGRMSKQTCGLLVCWMLLVFLVANAYKGVLFTLLTTLWFPTVPKSLQEVVESDYFVLSDGKINNGSVVSAAKYEIDNIVEEVEQGRLNISNVEFYKNLKKSIVFFGKDVDPPTLFSAIQKGEKLKRKDGNFTAIPEKIIIFDRESTLELFKELNAIFTSNTMLVLGQQIDLLWLRRQWMFRRNAIARLASPILIGLVESGIYERWGQYRSLYLTYKYLYVTKQDLLKFYNNSKIYISKKDNIIAYLLFKPYTAKPSPESGKPITMKFFFVFAQMLLYCLALSVLSFVFERLGKIEFFLLLFAFKKKIMCCSLSAEQE